MSTRRELALTLFLMVVFVAAVIGWQRDLNRITTPQGPAPTVVTSVTPGPENGGDILP